MRSAKYKYSAANRASRNEYSQHKCYSASCINTCVRRGIPLSIGTSVAKSNYGLFTPFAAISLSRVLITRSNSSIPTEKN